MIIKGEANMPLSTWEGIFAGPRLVRAAAPPRHPNDDEDEDDEEDGGDEDDDHEPSVIRKLDGD